MKKNIILSALVLFLSVQFSEAQSSLQPERVLDDLLNSAKTSAIKTNFKLTVTEKTNPQPIVSTGTFTLKDNKFVLDMSQMKVWFNGKAQWAYSASSNEVTITEPTEKELSETNPMAIIAGYKAKSNIRFAKAKSSQNHLIEMVPKIKKTDISKIEVAVNKSTGNLTSIKLNYTNGGVSLLTLNNFEKGLKVPDNTFSFNPSKYKGVSINDLR